jgi:hypothetical protein
MMRLPKRQSVQAETNGKVPVINPNSMAALGIEVVDVRIKQINLPAEVSEAIYNRMRAEREAVARRHRSQGQEEAEKLRAPRTMKSPRRWRKLSVRAVSCAVKVMPNRRNCLPMRSARIQTSMPLSVACVLTRIASRATRM